MARRYPKQQRPKTRVVSVSGQPRATPERQNFPIKLPILPLFTKRRVRTLQKVDVSKGLTMPEANDMTTAPGLTPMGPQTTRVVRQAPLVPPAPTKGQRVTAPPRSGGGVLKVFGKNRRIRNTSLRKR